MKLPQIDAFYYAELAHAAQATVNQLETWITRKHFVPSRPTAPGRSRHFSARDACRAAVMAYMVNRCGLPLGVGAYVAEMLRDQPHLFADMVELDLYALVFANADTAKVTRLPTPASVQAITFAVRWDGTPGSVAGILRDRDPTGVTIVNLSRIVREAQDRLAKEIDSIVEANSRHAAAGLALYDDVEE